MEEKLGPSEIRLPSEKHGNMFVIEVPLKGRPSGRINRRIGKRGIELKSSRTDVEDQPLKSDETNETGR